MNYILENQELGTQLKLVSKIGRGSFGQLYMGNVIGTQDWFAVKVFRKGDQINAQKEAEILKSLVHPNVVRFYSFIIHNDHAFITMDLATMSLSSLLNKRRHFSDPECRFFLKQLMAALCFFKLNLIVHCDIKHGNLLLDSQMNLLVCDFGTSVRLESMDELVLTFRGTKLFTASEVLMNTGYSFRVDVYAAGICLYMWISGNTPFDKALKSQNIEILNEDIKSGNYQKLSPSSVSPSAVKLVDEMLQTDPANRVDCDQVLKSDFIQNFFIPLQLPQTIKDISPKFYLFTRDPLLSVQSRVQFLQDTIDRILSKTEPINHSGQSLQSQDFDLNTIAWADQITMTDNGLGYHLTSGDVGFVFEDDTALLKIKSHPDNNIFVDQEGNGKFIDELDMTKVISTKLESFSSITSSFNENTNQPQLEQDCTRVCKYYRNYRQDLVIIDFSNGNIQLSDILASITFIMTSHKFIIIRGKEEKVVECYEWTNLEKCPIIPPTIQTNLTFAQLYLKYSGKLINSM